MKLSKRTILSIALVVSALFSANSIKAQNVDIAKAKEVGAYFMSAQFGSKAVTPATMEFVYDIPNTMLGISALYVFNTKEGNGFVVVSGTECVDPIIAYSTDGSFDPNNIPPNMQWWLNEQAAPIIYAQNEAIEADGVAKAQWRQLEEKSLPYFGTPSKSTFTLLTSKWNQSPLYNNWCPVMNGHRCVTGCVATAMAQIIYFWRYPRVGKSAKSYTWNGQQLSVNYEQQYYDYDLMIDDLLDGTATEDQINEVAKLSYHCGVSVEMAYTDETSSAVSDKVPKAMRQYFKYQKDSLKYLSRFSNEYYNPNSATNPDSRDSAWAEVLYTELQKGRPIYYSGRDPNGGAHAGHAFVCDGYNDQTMRFHFNWGWGGSCNCWCNVLTSKLKPTGSMSSYNFSNDHRVLIGIQPPNDSIQQDPPVSINTVDNPFTADIYPNPANNQVTISYLLADDNNAMLQIFDATGRKVKETVITPASNQITISVDNFVPGIYICRINGHTSKFVVK